MISGGLGVDVRSACGRTRKTTEPITCEQHCYYNSDLYMHVPHHPPTSHHHTPPTITHHTPPTQLTHLPPPTHLPLSPTSHLPPTHITPSHTHHTSHVTPHTITYLTPHTSHTFVQWSLSVQRRGQSPGSPVAQTPSLHPSPQMALDKQRDKTTL